MLSYLKHHFENSHPAASEGVGVRKRRAATDQKRFKILVMRLLCFFFSFLLEGKRLTELVEEKEIKKINKKTES